MRLVNYGAGEISDRLTILSLKILHAREGGQDLDHFVNERNVLLTQIRAKDPGGQWIDRILSLGAINAALWYAEDEMRRYRKVYDQTRPGTPAPLIELAECGMRIQSLNDQRIVMIEAINQETGEHLGAEKVTS